MTYKEIIEKYKDLFIILTEKAGSDSGILEYKNIDAILKKPENLEMVEELIEKEPDFKIVVSSFIVALLIEIYGPEKLEEWDEDKSSSHITEFYQLYLKKATIKFCEKYGLERFGDPEMAFRLVITAKRIIKK
jgi:hypothetical protein